MRRLKALYRLSFIPSFYKIGKAVYKRTSLEHQLGGDKPPSYIPYLATGMGICLEAAAMSDIYEIYQRLQHGDNTSFLIGGWVFSRIVFLSLCRLNYNNEKKSIEDLEKKLNDQP